MQAAYFSILCLASPFENKKNIKDFRLNGYKKSN
jgi:hypothetical protein